MACLVAKNTGTVKADFPEATDWYKKKPFTEVKGFLVEFA